MIVLDAGVLIGVLDSRDAHHGAALRLLEDEAPPYVVHPLTAAETLVGPARTGKEDEVWRDLTAAGVVRADLGADDQLTLARLRAAHSLKMPDTCVLATAEHYATGLATFDRRLAHVADTLGLLHPASPRF
ncbi:type II toxin-antitoxin system VapC family toxin [Microbacterium sp. NPDC057407]|uniref:type II toxin-antitoxin system VapC family toxin n=1 Tax=Microbacterium sp. NPDC057407 TaxID=3346120 RepID=UPI00367055E8